MARLGGYLLLGSILVAVAWLLFNYRDGTLYSMAVSAQAGVMVLLGLALYAVTGVPPA
jgi:hypothetical protein